MSTVTVPATDAPVIGDVDVVVCGAGSAGLGAALAAARDGARVALVERWPFFGGNATAASLGSVCGLYLRRGDDIGYLNGGITREWADALLAGGDGIGPIPYKDTAVMTFSPWGYKRLADRLVAGEPNITPLLHTFVCGVVRSGEDLEAVVLATKRGLLAIRGRVFIDATGDADIAFHAGCPWEMGEPGRLQYPSMQFFVQNVDLDEAFASGLGKLAERIREALDTGTHRLTRAGGAAIPTGRPGEVVGAMTRIAGPSGGPPDGTDPLELTHAEMSGRQVAEEAARFLRERVPGFSSAFLQDTPVSVGIRETRHVLGEHVITFEEAAGCAKHPDGVAASAWPFEFHTEGMDTRWESLPPGDWFEIPFSSLIVRGASNLLAAGRCISATHEALASSRVTGVCMAIGEAAGTAAARCVARDELPRELDGEGLRDELVTRRMAPVR